MHIRVSGGTGAGWRRQMERPKPWLCACMNESPEARAHRWPGAKDNPGYLARCPDCGMRRPDGPA